MRSEILNPYFRPITSIKGIGIRQADTFASLLNKKDSLTQINFIDLLFHLPINTIARHRLPDADGNNQLKNFIGQQIILSGTVVRHDFHRKAAKRITIACENSEQDEVDLVFFAAEYASFIGKKHPMGSRIVASGRLDYYTNRLQIVHPDHLIAEDRKKQIPEIEPVYSLVKGLTNNKIMAAITSIIDIIPDLPEWQDASFIKQQNWPSFNEALRTLHLYRQTRQSPSQNFNHKMADIERARDRLSYDELLAYQLTIALMRKHRQQIDRDKTGFKLNFSGTLQRKLLEILPFALTEDQKAAIEQINEDLKSPQRMLRLLQGDVGSGKTIVALAAAINAIESGKQVAIMAPTSLLAEQHMTNISQLLTKVGHKPWLLTRHNRQHHKEILALLASGKAGLIIGTHALLQKHVNFKQLGLVIIDEQHRFGVEQRLNLTTKGEANILVMSATPIPRTILLSYYGDMDICQLRNKPPGRQEIITKVMPIDRIDELIDRVNPLLARGNQVYWVCPRIEQSDDDGTALKRFEELKSKINHPIGLIHGRLPAQTRQQMMEQFSNKEIKLLIATTIIEVGVDVASAVVMVIEHAEMFGLAQLHQLRGRVGRGNQQSACILLYYPPLSQTAQARLNIMRDTDDGFKIAEQDLKLRGAGDILGTKQSGTPEYQINNPTSQAKLIKIANDEARLITHRDHFLASERGQALRLLLYLFRCDLAIRFTHG